MEPAPAPSVTPPLSLERLASRRLSDRIFYLLCLGIACSSVAILVLLLVAIGYQGASSLTPTFLSSSHDPENPDAAGMYPALVGSLILCLLCALVALPVGVGSAIFLEEFRPRGRALRWVHGFVQLNIANLAGVPSVVYGLLGLTVFVYMFQWFGKLEQNSISGLDLWGVERYYQFLALDERSAIFIPIENPAEPTFQFSGSLAGLDGQLRPIQVQAWEPGQRRPLAAEALARTVRVGEIGGVVEIHRWYYFRLPFGPSLLAGSLTLALVILPIIVIASQEALRAVPNSLREAAAGMGATRWQMTQQVTLPAALPGILTGGILAMGRAIGEAAPIFVVLGGNIGKRTGPEHLLDSCVTMPILIFSWADHPVERYRQLAAAAIIVLVVLLLLMNATAIFIRGRR